MKKLILSTLIISTLFACKNESQLKNIEIKTDSSEVKAVTKDTFHLKEAIKKTAKQLKVELKAKGFETLDHIDDRTKDTIVLQQYFMVFLRPGPIRSQNEEEAELLQNEHIAHLIKMYELGYVDISGRFGDKGAIRSVTVYNVPTFKMADSLAKSDPMVEKGNLVVEVHPWWTAKGYLLR